MHRRTDETFSDLVEQLLGRPLPPQMAGAISMESVSPETRDFIRRALALMQRANYAATEFNPALIRWLAVTVPSILPSAWGGRIPPLTLPGRHKKLDAYVAGQTRAPGEKSQIFVDVGCGFPPVTSADTAGALSDWHVYGVDYAFDDYVLYDPEGHYACFDREGGFQYFQALMNLSGRALYADPAATRNRFCALFEKLHPLLPDVSQARSQSVEKDGNRLIRHHIRDFEQDNLTFIKADITKLEIEPAGAIRCMNVLVYFEPAIRQQMLRQMGRLLADEGIVMAGTNGLGIQARYTVYRKRSGRLHLEEFAFGLENVGHIVFMPFFTIHPDDPEALLLARLAGTIRADDTFWPDFSARQDELLEQHGICRRNADGYLHFSQADIPPAEYLKLNFLIWQQLQADGYLDGAVKTLQKAGYETWKNPIGDIAIRPTADADLI